jgi:hypothetical protein
MMLLSASTVQQPVKGTHPINCLCRQQLAALRHARAKALERRHLCAVRRGVLVCLCVRWQPLDAGSAWCCASTRMRMRMRMHAGAAGCVRGPLRSFGLAVASVCACRPGRKVSWCARFSCCVCGTAPALAGACVVWSARAPTVCQGSPGPMVAMVAVRAGATGSPGAGVRCCRRTRAHACVGVCVLLAETTLLVEWMSYWPREALVQCLMCARGRFVVACGWWETARLSGLQHVTTHRHRAVNVLSSFRVSVLSCARSGCGF